MRRIYLIILIAFLAFTGTGLATRFIVDIYNVSHEETTISRQSDISNTSVIVELATPKKLEYMPSKEEIDTIAKTLYGECRGVSSDREKAAVAWVILNRIDAGYGDSILEVVSAPYQFLGYNPNHPVLDDLADISEDVLVRWYREQLGEAEVGRVIPPDYLFFAGDGESNYFRKEFDVHTHWDWSLENPYKN